MPLLMVGLTFLPLWLSTLNDGGETDCRDRPGGIYAPCCNRPKHFISRLLAKKLRQTPDEGRGKLFAILQITGDLSNNQGSVSLTSEKQSPQELQSLIRQTLREKVTQQRLDQLSGWGGG